MKGFKPLALKGITQKHKAHLKDKMLHTAIESNGIKKVTFNKLIHESTEHQPFDKKKK